MKITLEGNEIEVKQANEGKSVETITVIDGKMAEKEKINHEISDLKRRVSRLERILYGNATLCIEAFENEECCSGHLLPIETLVKTKTPLNEIK